MPTPGYRLPAASRERVPPRPVPASTEPDVARPPTPAGRSHRAIVRMSRAGLVLLALTVALAPGVAVTAWMLVPLTAMLAASTILLQRGRLLSIDRDDDLGRSDAPPPDWH